MEIDKEDLTSPGDNLHEVSDPIFLRKISIQCSFSSAEFVQSMVSFRKNTEVLAGKIANDAEEIQINIKKNKSLH